MKRLALLALLSVSAVSLARAETGRVALTDFSADAKGDYAAAFDAAIRSLCPGDGAICGGVVVVPVGVFPVSRSVEVPDGIRIRGGGDGTVIVSSGVQCSGDAPPSTVFRFRRNDNGLPGGGIESLVVTTEDERGFVPCANWSRDRNEFSQSYKGGSGAFDGCYSTAETGERRFEPKRMNSIGVLVEGGSRGRFRMSEIKMCGLGTGIVLRDAAGGFAVSTTSTLNNTGLVVEGASDWTFENLMFHANEVGVLLRSSATGTPSRNIHVMGGLVQTTAEVGALVKNCLNCSLEGIHFENNGSSFGSGGDIHVDGSGVVRHFSSFGENHSAWPGTLVENQASNGCPVDFLSFDDDVGLGWSNHVELRSDCPLHLRTDPAWMTLSRTPSSRPAAPTIFDVGGPLVMGTTGQLGLGIPPGNAALTLRAPTPAPLLEIRATQGASSLRIRPVANGVKTELRVTAEPALALHLQVGDQSGVVISADGRVGVGATPGAGALTVNGDLVAKTLLMDGFQTEGDARGACDSARRGTLVREADRVLICVQAKGAFRWSQVGP